MDNLGVLELTTEEIDDAALKNRFISQCQKDYLAVVDNSKFTKEALERMILEEDMFSYGDVLVFCAGEAQDAVQLSLEDVVGCFSLQIVALAFRRDLLATSGNYNYRLQGMTDFELLCRLTTANGNAIFVFPGIEEDAFCVTEREAQTCAYVVRHYLKELQACGKTEGILQQICHVMEQCGVLTEFKAGLSNFLGSQDYYERIAAVTAPFVVLRGDEACFGVLQDFADSLTNCLRAMGQAYILAETGKTDYNYLMNHVCKAIVGFQSKAFKLDYFKSLHGPKLQFWFDNPVFYEYHFADLEEDCYILCHDANYVDYIKERYHKRNALLFPPAGHMLPWLGEKERPYDIVFIGKYEPEAQEPFNGLDKKFYEYMLEHPGMTFTDGLKAMLEEQEVNNSEFVIGDCFVGIKHICQSVINYYRKKVMETILAAGYEVHVYGDSWNMFQSPYADRLIRHPEVSVEESIAEWQKAKIGLNVMSWHKAGMTERIANIMLSGAACLSEETSYLKKNFKEDKQVVMFQLDHLEELPEKIEQLLENQKWREIARNGYEVASREHTWEQRTMQLVNLVEEII